MKTVGDKLEEFRITGVKPGALEPNGAFEKITEKSFEGKWKVIVYYPKDFTFVCPTEIIAYDKLNKDFADRDAVLLIGSTDNEFCKLAWKNAHEGLRTTTSWFFADTARSDDWHDDEQGLVQQLGVFYKPAGAALRATFIVDPENVIQHVTVNSLAVGRNADETLRVLDALQTGELCQCGRQIGEATLNAA
jgi:alkyl hydroperoxide reductase subunit AhpC